MAKCGKGYVEREGKCVKKKKGVHKQSTFGLEPKQKFGFLMVGLSFLIWFMRPFKECESNWYDVLLPWTWPGNIACAGASASFTVLFGIIMLILLLGGVVYLLRLDKLLL